MSCHEYAPAEINCRFYLAAKIASEKRIVNKGLSIKEYIDRKTA